MHPTDEELMSAYRDGDSPAFDALYARHKGRLFRYVLRGVRTRGVAEELYQEIWLRVIEARRRYQASAKFTTWLYTIAHHRLVDHWRRKEIALAGEPDAEETGSDSADPVRLIQGREALARLARALAGLPHAQREAFLLHEEAGLTALEIAAATASEPEAVKSRLRYAYEKLKAAVENG